MKLSVEQKQAFINENLEQFFASPKTSSEEYKNNFNAMDVEKQYAVVLRWKKYQEKKINGTTTTKRTSTRTSSNPIFMLMNGQIVELSTQEAESLMEQFNLAYNTCEKIIELNKINEKKQLEEQIKELQARLKELK